MQQLNLPFKDKYQDFTTGTIQRGDPDQIKLDQEITFFVFKVVLGRSYVMKKSVLERELAELQQNPKNILPKGYESIYIQGDESQGDDLVKHTYRIFDKEKVRLLYRVKAQIKIDQTNDINAPQCDWCK